MYVLKPRDKQLVLQSVHRYRNRTHAFKSQMWGIGKGFLMGNDTAFIHYGWYLQILLEPNYLS